MFVQQVWREKYLLRHGVLHSLTLAHEWWLCLFNLVFLTNLWKFSFLHIFIASCLLPLCNHSHVYSIGSLSPKAQWNDQKVVSLLECLESLETNKFEGKGSGNFKDSTFTKVVIAVAPFLSAGQSNIEKWSGWVYMSFFIVIESASLTKPSSSLKWPSRLFTPIATMSRDQDDINGANIQGEAAASAFNSYISKLWKFL